MRAIIGSILIVVQLCIVSIGGAFFLPKAPQGEFVDEQTTVVVGGTYVDYNSND